MKEKRSSVLLFDGEGNRASDTLFDSLKNIYNVIYVKTGNDAYEVLKKRDFDLIVMGIMAQPGRGSYIPKTEPARETGVYILRELRQGKFQCPKDVPVVVLSSVIEYGILRKIRELLGDDGCILFRPKKTSSITEKIKELLQ